VGDATSEKGESGFKTRHLCSDFAAFGGTFERTSGQGLSPWEEEVGRVRAVSHYMDVDAVVSLLLEEHGNTKARAKALREQQNARRARSRKRFAFWVAVASGIDARQAGPASPCDRRPVRTS
jgi:hypothetical protein